MTARDDGTPRLVRVLTTIRTRGKLCASERPDYACRHLGTYLAVCKLFDKQLDVTPAQEPLRCPDCLALDEPDALDKQLAQDKGAPYG